MIEISFQYQSLFKVTVAHKFYKEQPAKDFSMQPVPDTSAIARKLGIILKEADKEIISLRQPEYQDALLMALEKGKPLRFTFILTCSNPYFVNYTEVPHDSIKDIFYFSTAKSHSSGEEILLHEKEFAGLADLFPVVSAIELAGGDKGKKVEIRDEFGASVFEKELASGQTIHLDNRTLPIGKYELYEGGKLIRSVVLFSNMPALKPIGLVSISYSGDQAEKLIQSLKEGDTPSYRFKINFNNRQTFWKYFLVQKYNDALKNTSIVSKEAEVGFSGPEEVVLGNGVKAVQFTSKTALPLHERGAYRFQLKSTKAGMVNGKVVVETLPLPSVEMIKPETKESNSRIFSEIIVYV